MPCVMADVRFHKSWWIRYVVPVVRGILTSRSSDSHTFLLPVELSWSPGVNMSNTFTTSFSLFCGL